MSTINQKRRRSTNGRSSILKVNQRGTILGGNPTLKIDIPFVRKEGGEKLLTITKHIPIPPGSKLSQDPRVVQFDKRIEDEERKENKKRLQDFLEDNSLDGVDKKQWVARAMKRNPDVLNLMERLRPLSKKESFSRLNKFDDKSPNHLMPKQTSTTECRGELTRENVVQMIYQHYYSKGEYSYQETIKKLKEETGISYNGMYKESPSILKSCLSMGITDAENVKELQDTGMEDLTHDIEVQTSSIYTHLDREYDPNDLRKNIWEELLSTDENKDNFEIKDKELKLATLNKLIQYLTSDDAENNFLDTFLITYRSFTTPEVLLNRLIERYKVPDLEQMNDPNMTDDQWNQRKKIIRLRTGNVLQKWIPNYFYDWSQAMILMTTDFIDDYLLKKSETINLGKSLKTKLNRELKNQRKKGFKTVFSNSDVQLPIVPRNIFSNSLQLNDIDETELARQITLMEHDTFSKIKPVELLNCAWSKENLKHRSVNVLRSTALFNQFSKEITNSILQPKTLKERKINMQRAYGVARALFKLKNFNDFLSVTSGLSNAGVHRLKWTKLEIDQRLHSEFEENIKVMSSDNSFKVYRAHILGLDPPLVPYLGIYLTDLTFIEDGNADVINHSVTGRELINWKKRKLVYAVIQQIQQYQDKPFDILPVYQIQQCIERLLDKSFPDEKEFFKMSLEREPRSAQSKEDLPQ
eukprot:gene6336-10343_t